MSNNSLTPVNESIFSKIKCFFKKIFVQQEINNDELYAEENIVSNLEEVIDTTFNEKIKVEETEEQKLLRLQRLIRDKKISENDLSVEEKDKLRKMYNAQIKELRSSILQKRIEIIKIKYEQKRKSHANT